ncbi:BamA/TamA family outer membrane protein [Epibacterium sp. SM1979]|uniref:BamA/TamA family outer membrane protein n=1 Tax=Tritonibacter litoralis TaxID=2662264 RepID=A0A843YD47_9RHOB|nr:BamA/TamA family outer membrane protein [Tritonibacter litoralis]MQQ09280.1 BamA/TamA family outer membrane protein [Tritonibacter litoralis]
MISGPDLSQVLRNFAVAAGLCAILCLATPVKAVPTDFSTPSASEDLRERLLKTSATWRARGRSADAVQDILAAALSDYRSLVQVLYDQGFFSPVVSIKIDGREAAGINPLRLPAKIETVRITVDPGASFTLGRATVAPLPANPQTPLPNDFRSGAPANTGILRDAAAAGVTAWRQEGHAKADVSGQSITANHRTRRLDAQIQLQPGPQLRLGQLDIKGPSDVRDEAIRRIAGLPEGARYHPDLVAKSANRLRRTGAFSSVVLREDAQANPDQTLDFTAEVSDQPKRRFTFGGELTSDGAEISTTWTHRNLFGGAERFRFETRLSGIGGSSDIDGRIGVRLERPATLGPDDSTFYLAELERLDEEHYTALRALGAIGVRRIYSDTLEGEIALGAASSLVTDAFGKRRFRYLFARAKLEQDLRNSTVNATNGHFLSATVTPFVGLRGAKSGLQFIGDARIYRPIGNRLVAAARFQLGSLLGPGLSEVSPTLGFFSGGAGTVRGQEFQAFGVPVGGETAAGRGFAAVSAELRGQLTDSLSLVGFYDIGLVSADSFPTSGDNQHSGAGIGLRYDIAGIGPLRLDLAVPVSGGTEDGLQFYIGIGQAF